MRQARASSPKASRLALPKIWLLSDILKNSGIKDASKLVPFHMTDLDRPDWLHWVKLFSIILVPAIVLGLIFAFGDYVRQYTASMQFDRAVAQGWVKLDTWDWMRRRFVQGACAGAAFGLLYKIQWNLRNRVP
jgi:hypothetical protein